MSLTTFAYNRRRAIEYAHRWAYFRNPNFLSFSDLGGDCTNFASQCLYAGSGIMNYTPTFGWYYISPSDRTASWTGVEYFFNFVTQNEGVGPYGNETDITGIQPGDFIQLQLDQDRYQHTPIVTEIRGLYLPDSIYVTAHDRDSDCRPLSSYDYQKIRFIHIEGVRRDIFRSNENNDEAVEIEEITPEP